MNSSARKEGNTGVLQAIDAMNHFFLNHEMFVAGAVYWNMGYGRLSGDVCRIRKDWTT